MTLKYLCFLLCTILVLSACTPKTTNSDTGSQINFEGYPIETDASLTYWLPLNLLVSETAQNLGDTPFGKALSQQTGININFIHAPQEREREQFTILFSSDELPDIIEYSWYNFPGGPQRALDEQIIIPLNSVFDEYCPNITEYLAGNPAINKMVKTDDGVYYMFPFIRGDEKLLVSHGPMLRGDWLNELGLSVPKTIDQWQYVLTQFKDKKNASAPLSFTGTPLPKTFLGAFGINSGFYLENGKVICGSNDPRFRDFLNTFALWYKEGLLDNNFINADSKLLTANVLSGSTGATIGYAGSSLGTYIRALQEQDPNASFVPAPYPAQGDDDPIKRGHKDLPFSSSGAAITTSCKNIELAARLLDYGYSREGNMLFNFGIEGESYNIVDGYPVYTNTVMRNSDGLSVSAAMARYMRSCFSGPFVQRKEYIEQYYELPQQKAALTVWAGDDEQDNKPLPHIVFTSEESLEIADIMNNITPFVDEYTYQYIMGHEDILSFDAYLSTLKDYGIERALEIYENAYQRYKRR